jgi:hypothetical protein
MNEIAMASFATPVYKASSFEIGDQLPDFSWHTCTASSI